MTTTWHDLRRALQRFRRMVITTTIGVAVVGAGWVATGAGIPVFGHADILNGSGVAAVILFAAVGFLIAAAIAWARASTSRRFERPADPMAVYGKPLITTVPEFERPPAGHTALPVLTHPADEAAESFRTLATVLRARRAESKVLMVAVSSAEVGAGSTTAVANCGLALAEMGERVLVVDGDPLNRALTHALVVDVDTSGLGLPPMGLSELLEGRPLHETMFHSVGGTGLLVVPSGRNTDMAIHRWRTSTLRAALDDLGRRFDMILFDTPPIGSSSFSLDVAGVAGHLVLVVPHQDLAEAHDALANRLPAVGVDLLGYVYNAAPSNIRFAPYFPVVRGARQGSGWDVGDETLPTAPRMPEADRAWGWR